MAQDLERATAVADVEQRAEEAGADYEVGLESLSQWQLAWRKFKKHRLALIGLAILIGFALIAVIGPMIAIRTSASRIPSQIRARRCLRNFRQASCHWLSDLRPTS